MKKKILNFGVIATLPLVATSAISCFGPQGKEIKVDISEAYEFLTGSTKYPYIQNNDQKGGKTIDIPFFNKGNFDNMKDILENSSKPDKEFFKSITDKDDIPTLKSHFLALNKQVADFVNKNNTNNQYVAFYGFKINDSYKVELYKLKTPKATDDFEFLDKEVKDSYDFQASAFKTEDGTENNGVPLRVTWPLRSINPIPWNTSFSSQKEKETFVATWKGFYANRIGSRQTLETAWQKHKVNLMTYPYIDYEHKEFKILVVAFHGGGFEEYDKGDFTKVKISSPKTLKYKTITLKNALPFTSTPTQPTSQQEKDFKQSLEYLKEWFIDTFDPKTLFALMDNLVQTIPQIQLLFIEPQEFIKEYSKQVKVEEDKLLRGLRRDEKLNLKIFKDFLDPTHYNKIKQNFIDNNFDFSKSNEIMNQLKDFNLYDTNWLRKIKKDNQKILVNMLILLKYSSDEWKKVK